MERKRGSEMKKKWFVSYLLAVTVALAPLVLQAQGGLDSILTAPAPMAPETGQRRDPPPLSGGLDDIIAPPADGIRRIPGPVTSPQPAPEAMARSAATFDDVARHLRLRRDLLETARARMRVTLGLPLVFEVETLRSGQGWAFLMVVPRAVDGTAFDWSQTPYARDWQADAMSDIIMILLQNTGAGWRIVEDIVGPTDVYWITWMQDYALPAELFHAD